MKSFAKDIKNGIEGPMQDMADKVRNSTLETAARVAKPYGAPDEACKRILMLRAASTRSGSEG